MSKASKDIPADIIGLLQAADAKNGFPKGLMAALMQQEIGGNYDKYLGNPGEYHYPLNESGKRIAKHSGKESNAFGPFGILDSTAAKPGYGVAPLKDKSLGEQIRFASEYLGARIKSAGGIRAGLAGYGEGNAYAERVLSRVGGGMAQPPVAVAQQPASHTVKPAENPAPTPGEIAGWMPTAQVTQSPAPKEEVPAGPDPWQEYLAASSNSAQAQQPVAQQTVRPSDFAIQMARFGETVAQARPVPVDFSAFRRLGKA